MARGRLSLGGGGLRRQTVSLWPGHGFVESEGSAARQAPSRGGCRTGGGGGNRLVPDVKHRWDEKG